MTQSVSCDQEKMELVLGQYTKGKRDGLIPLLQDVQDIEGYVSKDSVVKIGEHLELPCSKIYGVATFYNQFRFKPLGQYHISICRGTACHVKGSKGILETLEKALKIRAGETARDGVFSLEVVACIGACGLAPVISVNGDFFANMDEHKIENLVGDLEKSAATAQVEV